MSAALLAGCASAGGQRPTTGRSGTALTSYLRQIEPIRLAVNRLLNQADPILEAFHRDRIGPGRAARLMGSLEGRFAAYAVDVNAIQPATSPLRALHDEYAHTYILEDAYLSALVTGLAGDRLDGLPNTQSAQRDAIIGWRIGLTVLARETHTALPADLQQAGRGEIAPSPQGS